MAKQVQFRRGTTAQLSSVTGVEGELFVDTTKDTLTVHDGYQAGGFPLLREDLDNLANNTVNIAKLAVGTGTAGQAIKVNSAGNGFEFGVAGGVLAVHSFRDATQNITTGNTSDYSQSFTFNKQFADSHIMVHGWTPIMGQNSYQGGEYLEFAGNRQYNGCNHMSPPGGMTDANDGISTAILWSGFWQGAGAGTGNKTITFGWDTRDNTNQRLGNIWNPHQRSARMRSKTTVMMVYELASSVTNSIT